MPSPRAAPPPPAAAGGGVCARGGDAAAEAPAGDLSLEVEQTQPPDEICDPAMSAYLDALTGKYFRPSAGDEGARAACGSVRGGILGPAARRRAARNCRDSQMPASRPPPLQDAKAAHTSRDPARPCPIRRSCVCLPRAVSARRRAIRGAARVAAGAAAGGPLGERRRGFFIAAPRRREPLTRGNTYQQGRRRLGSVCA